MKTITLTHKFHNEKITYWGVKKFNTFNGIMEIIFDEKSYIRVIKDIAFYNINVEEE